MNEELALLTIGYLVGYYKTHEETIINEDEIDAINFIIEKNETLEQELQKYKSLYQNEKDKNDTLVRIVKKIEEKIKKHLTARDYSNHKYVFFGREYLEELYDLLKEIK